ncbi:protein kinase [Bradyrhizobium sp. CCGUVB1N3]|uniref:protein kinase domain-containing protein n=1 Tax=Bradyrhizobium sp. CCGUVB1N3 TaxID=2949629 RepID=UPI0020B1B8D4|nr:protein kinase [Bradyrhizobium sp. CCGUVB1N3]MCP3469772.1 protein kinase [Bradyrhizobium sp. CCGUVB1N3]
MFSLIGKETDDGWKVIEPVGWKLDTTGKPVAAGAPGSGGNFSAGYRVQKDGRKAFLKAIDLSRAMLAKDVIAALKVIVDTASFEKSLCAMCGEKRMDRVVLALSSGDFITGVNLQDRVPYIIFELADGDVRRRVRLVDSKLRLQWVFRAIQNSAVGLRQLHKANVAHQDFKPSNVLQFEAQKAFKVGDVGRAVLEGVAVAHDSLRIAGDPAYAPPELLYGHLDPDWRTRRYGCDLFMFGSLIVFFFMGQGLTPLLIRKIEAAYLPRARGGTWAGTYMEVLPIVRRAFADVLEELAALVPNDRAIGRLRSMQLGNG